MCYRTLSVLMAVLSIASVMSGADWPMYRGNPARSGVIPQAEFGTLPSPKLIPGTILWQFSTAYWLIETTPAVANGKLYFGTENGDLYALDLAKGNLCWKYAAGKDICTSPAVVEGTVYFGCDDGKLYALDAGNGALKWSFLTGSFIRSSPAVGAGVATFGSADGNFYGVDTSSGKLRWKLPAGKEVSSSPLISGSRVIFSSYSACHALQVATGEEIWRTEIGENLGCPTPSLDNGVVCLGADGNLLLLEEASGKILGKIATPISHIQVPVVDRGVAYFGAMDYHFYALDIANQRIKWRSRTNGPVTSPAAVIGKSVYCGTFLSQAGRSAILLLDADSGQVAWSCPMEAPMSKSSPIVGNGTAYFGALDSKCYALVVPSVCH